MKTTTASPSAICSGRRTPPPSCTSAAATRTARANTPTPPATPKAPGRPFGSSRSKPAPRFRSSRASRSGSARATPPRSLPGMTGWRSCGAARSGGRRSMPARKPKDCSMPGAGLARSAGRRRARSSPLSAPARTTASSACMTWRAKPCGISTPAWTAIPTPPGRPTGARLPSCASRLSQSSSPSGPGAAGNRGPSA